mgnify:CR=1 FL=1
MAREKFSTLTEQMFYILLCLREECCGMDVMARVNELTGGRVAVGPGTHRRDARGGAAAQLSAHSGGKNAAAKRGGAPAGAGAGLREAI